MRVLKYLKLYNKQNINKFLVRLHGEYNKIIYLFSFVETPRKFIIAELSIRKLGSSSVLIILVTMIISANNMQLLDETEQNIVIYQWRADQLFADAEGRVK